MVMGPENRPWRLPQHVNLMLWFDVWNLSWYTWSTVLGHYLDHSHWQKKLDSLHYFLPPNMKMVFFGVCSFPSPKNSLIHGGFSPSETENGQESCEEDKLIKCHARWHPRRIGCIWIWSRRKYQTLHHLLREKRFYKLLQISTEHH